VILVSFERLFAQAAQSENHSESHSHAHTLTIVIHGRAPVATANGTFHVLSRALSHCSPLFFLFDSFAASFATKNSKSKQK